MVNSWSDGEGQFGCSWLTGLMGVGSQEELVLCTLALATPAWSQASLKVPHAQLSPEGPEASHFSPRRVFWHGGCQVVRSLLFSGCFKLLLIAWCSESVGKYSHKSLALLFLPAAHFFCMTLA